MNIISDRPGHHAARDAWPLWQFACPSQARHPSRVSVRTAQRLCDLTMAAASVSFAVPVHEVAAATRVSADVALARQCAMYLAHIVFGLNLSAIGRAFGRDRTTVAYACRVVEERRDDPPLARLLEPLERACGLARRKLSAPVQS